VYEWRVVVNTVMKIRGFDKMRGISWLTEETLLLQKGVSSRELIIQLDIMYRIKAL
jgi:hypothetical protein